MKTFNYLATTIAVALLVGLALLGSLSAPAVQGAPAALVTPAPSYPSSGNPPRVITFWDGSAGIAADTRTACFDASGYALADVHWKIDQGTVNTVSVTLERAVDTGISYETADTLATDNAADADGLVQSQLWGRYLCAYADVTNTDTVTITVKALLH